MYPEMQVIDLDNPVNRALFARLDAEERAMTEAEAALRVVRDVVVPAQHKLLCAQSRLNDTIQAIALLTDTAVMDCSTYLPKETRRLLLAALAEYRANPRLNGGKAGGS